MKKKNEDLDSQSTNKFNAFILKILTDIPGHIDDFVRLVDNGFGGTQTIKWFHGRSLFAFFLPLVVYTFIVWGPSLARNNAEGLAWRGGFGAALLLAGAAVLQAAYFLSKYRGKMAWIHLGLIFILSLATWVIAGSDSLQASSSLYRHYYGLLAFMALLVAVPLAWGLRHWKLFQIPSEMIEDFQKNFDTERVLAQGKAKEPESWDVISAFISVVLRTPLHVVTPVAFLVLFLPPDHLKLLAGIATVLSLMLIATSSYDSERDAFNRLVHHTLLTGGSLIVTLVITTLAVLRLVGFDYATTILDAGPNLIFLSYILSTYAVFWLYDFWVNQAILDLLGNLDNFKNGKEKIRRHGGGRIAVPPGGNKGRPRMFTPEAFLMRIAQTAKEETLRESLQQIAMKIEQRFRIFRGVCLLGLLLLLFLLGLGLHCLDQEPGLKGEVAATGSNNGPIFNLTDHLMKPDPKPLVMLAASGGGTRAALYTTAVLHSLAERNLLDRLVLASGVSGGSAALAYFALHWPSLIPNDKGAWGQMRETLSAPFIEDVLAGAAEWRIVSRYRLGQLLTESFQRRFLKDGGAGHTELRTTLGDIKELGLIFNTALCGSPSLPGSSSSKESADEAGGRLVLTNLSSDFDHKPKEGNFWKLDLPFEIVRDPRVPLFAAASLSANFPPVFSNAAVAVDGKRFWVTDGGAVENRGLVSILLVLAEELEKIQSKTTATDKKRELADIRIIVADASAFQPNYKSDRGMGAMFGASEQLSNRLIKELELRVVDLHKKISGREKGIKIIYLPMPNAMRSSGTFGTHWMMPSTVTLRDPSANNGKDPGVTLPGKEVREIIDALFSKEYSKGYIQKRWPKLEADSFFEETKKPRTELDANLR